MAFLKESCYGMAPLNSKESPLDFSCVFKDREEAKRLGDITTATVTNDNRKNTELYLLESAVYLPGRTSAEMMWRFLHEAEGNRLLHQPVQFGNVWVRDRRFEYKRDMGGYTTVSVGLPSTIQIADSLSALSPDLASCQKNTVYRAVDSLFELILESNRNGRQIDPEKAFDGFLAS